MKLSGPTFVLCLCVLALGQFAASFEPARASRVARANEILWRDPGVIAKRDLYWGMGNAARAPRPPFTFVEESTSGNRPKVEVKDAAGVKWMVKLTPTDPLYNEVNAEIAATRLMWALGYQVDENYFIKSGKIIGAKGLTRAAETIGPDGSFTKARFERRDPEWDEVGFWNIEDSVFKGTKELSGFHAALLLMNSWDVKPANTVILRSKGEKPNELYIMSDLGSTFGSMKGSNNRSRWDLEMYKTTEYVTGVVEGTKFQFHHTLLGNKPIIIPIEHARWFSGLASQLTDPQLRRLFEAAGGTPAEVAGFAAAVRAKIQELQTALAKAK
jgi:hypothetical protein